jgi:hypothetical protein
MGNPIHIAVVLALLAFVVAPAFLTARLAERKGRSFAVYLVASLMIGWPIPLLATLILRRERDQRA